MDILAPKPNKPQLEKKPDPKPVTKKIIKPESGSKKENWFKKAVKYFKENRKAQITALVILILIVIAIIVAIVLLCRSDAFKFKEQLKFAKEEPKEMPRRTDGVIVPTKQANKYPVAVMIENLSEVRPQRGLSKAQIIYETVVEGNITRFMAIYAGGQADEIHPVRSARPYYIEWLSEYDAIYAHCGGSQEALETISAFKIKDLNEIGGGTQFFWRGEGYAPHNLYTSTKLLDLGIRDMKLDNTKPTFASWKFKDQKKKEERTQEEKWIKINFAGDYSVEYKYDSATNSYLRFNPIGIEQKDALDDKQLSPKNVIVQHVPKEEVVDDYGRLRLIVTGEDKVEIFHDGEVIEGTWKKAERTSRTKFYDSLGAEIPLTRGQVWITVVPEGFSVEWK